MTNKENSILAEKTTHLFLSWPNAGNAGCNRRLKNNATQLRCLKKSNRTTTMSNPATNALSKNLNFVLKLNDNCMTNSKFTFLVLGGTGRTGKHFVSIALNEGHKVVALVRNPEKVDVRNANLKLIKGAINDCQSIDELLNGVDFVISMLGDAKRQKKENVNTEFVKKLIPAMRRQKVKRFLYQAGGFSRPYKEELPFIFWVLKKTLVRFAGLLGQHRDNEAVIEYLTNEAGDIEWMVHRASLISDEASKGTLLRSKTKNSLANFVDCAMYNYRLLSDDSAVHTCDLSYYSK